MYSTELIEYVMKRTGFKARQVISKVPALGDAEDMQHDLIEDVLRRLPKFDGDRASINTFVCRIIDNKIATLLKRHHAACRGNGCTSASLDEWKRDETRAWTRRNTTVEATRGRAHRGVAPRSDQEQRELKLDTAHVLASLPPAQQKLCVQLLAQTPAEIARKAGTSRSVLYKRITAIRAVFVVAGLHHYL